MINNTDPYQRPSRSEVANFSWSISIGSFYTIRILPDQIVSDQTICYNYNTQNNLIQYIFNPFSAGTLLRRQNLTLSSTDVRFWRLKTIPTLKVSNIYDGRWHITLGRKNKIRHLSWFEIEIYSCNSYFFWKYLSASDGRPNLTKHIIGQKMYSICTTSAQRLRHWFNFVQMLYKCSCFSG